VATAVGLFVAIPAVVGYNVFQRKVKDMLLSAERTKNAILGQG
jgi:biopolymer transport protein ExbB/TolQ